MASLPTFTSHFQWPASLFHCYLLHDLTQRSATGSSLQKSDAFIFKYQAVNSENESKVRVFSPLPKIPDVHLTEAEELLTLGKTGVTGNGGMYAQKHCRFHESDETYGLLMTELKDPVNLIKLELKQPTNEQDKLADVMKTFLP